MHNSALADAAIEKYRKGDAPLSYAEASALLVDVQGWQLNEEGTAISCHLAYKNYDEALMCVNRVSKVAEVINHHPDISFGWGYCHIVLRTHIINGLHKNDFIAAAKFNRVICG